MTFLGRVGKARMRQRMLRSLTREWRTHKTKVLFVGGLLIQNFHVLGFSHAVGEELVTAGGELCAIHPPWAEHVV